MRQLPKRPFAVLAVLVGLGAVTLATAPGATAVPSAGPQRPVPPASARLTGVVRNANDGLGVAGATIVVDRQGRSATTDGSGRCHLVVRPGRVTTVPALDLPAPHVVIHPDPLGAADPAGFGGGVTLANDGGLPLHWELFKRSFGRTRPVPVAVAPEPYIPLADRRVDRHPSVDAQGRPVPEGDDTWVYIQTLSGEVPPGGSTFIRFGHLGRFVAQGDNWVEVRIETDDPRRPTIRVPVYYFAACPPRSGVPDPC